MTRKIETTYKAIFFQMPGGAYNGKQFVVADGTSSPSVATAKTYRVLGAVGFGGYVGDVEIQILCVKRDRYDESATRSTIVSKWYARFDSDGVFNTASIRENLDAP